MWRIEEITHLLDDIKARSWSTTVSVLGPRALVRILREARHDEVRLLDLPAKLGVEELELVPLVVVLALPCLCHHTVLLPEHRQWEVPSLMTETLAVGRVVRFHRRFQNRNISGIFDRWNVGVSKSCVRITSIGTIIIWLW